MRRTAEQHGGPRSVAAGAGQEQIELGALGGEDFGGGALEKAPFCSGRLRDAGEGLLERAVKVPAQEGVDGDAAGSSGGERPRR